MSLLTVLAIGLLLVPRWQQRRWQGESNLDWLALRQGELNDVVGEDRQALSRDAELRILDESSGAESEQVLPNSGTFAGGRRGVLSVSYTHLTLPTTPYV